jgi:putative restriction endonuclease
MSESDVLHLYAARFRRLRLNRRTDGGYSPHKACMLLAVLEMARAGELQENRINYDPALLERYLRYFGAARGPSDHANPYFPFFHLQSGLTDRTPSFWHLVAQPGRELALAALTSARTPGHITGNVAYATLDPALHALIQSPEACDALSEVVADTWLDRSHNDLAGLLRHSAAISSYERSLRGAAYGTGTPLTLTAAEAAPPAYVRSPAFRRVVIQAYDYRCAASGERIITPSGEALVEAAHIHPFSESGDDDPRNGLALSRDMHWAMDRNLIAPGPDLKWHVSTLLDSRIPDFRRLCELDGRALLLPSETRLTPKREVLEWRLERLRDAGWAAPRTDGQAQPPELGST